MLNLIVATIGLILQVLVVYYGYKMYRILNPVRYWTFGWLFFSAANLMILIRRCIGVYSLCSPLTFSWSVFFEFILQILISIFMLLFVKQLNHLYGKYFTNGLDIPSWSEEQERQKK